MNLSLYQAPLEGTLMAAYRPIRISVKTGLFGTTDVVYADVYFNGTLYQTIHTTIWTRLAPTLAQGGGLFRQFDFDFQRVCQDFLKSRLPATIGGAVIDTDPGGMASMQVRFRSGDTDSSGLLQVNPSAELSSPTLLVVSAALPHDSVPSFQEYLAQYKTQGAGNTWNVATLRLLPLTERVQGCCFANLRQFDHYPFIAEWYGLANSNAPVSGVTMLLDYVYKSTPTITTTVSSNYNAAGGSFTITASVINYLPVGIPQLKLITWMPDETPLWDRVIRWRIRLRYDSTIPLVTPWMQVPPADCDEAPRIRFLNRLGAYDSANFEEATLETDTTSSSFQSAVKSIPPVNGLRVRGRQRYNVRTAQRITATTTLYPETAQDWLSQLIDSPDVFIERPPAPGRPADFIPVVVEDAKALPRKTEERYEYEQIVVFRYANETPRQRM